MIKLPNRNTHHRGFTLMELLITMSIIAILSLIGFTTYNSVQVSGRDTKRKQDLRSIATALELYYQQNKRYPCTDDSSTNSIDTPGAWQYYSTSSWWLSDSTACTKLTSHIPFDTNYINQLPIDPTNSSGNPVFSQKAYEYAYWSGITSGGNCPGGTNQYYILAANLENSNDGENNATKNYLYCDGATPITSNKNLYVITSP